MIGFGILIGIVFPFFVMLFGVKPAVALSPFFVTACILAGAFVGSINIFLTRSFVVRRLETTTKKMIFINENVLLSAQGVLHEPCDYQTCQIDEASDDAIGQNAKAFNQLVETLSITMRGGELLGHLDVETIANVSLSDILSITNSMAGCILIEKEGELRVVASFGLIDTEYLTTNKIMLSVASNRPAVKVSFSEDVFLDGVLSRVRPKEILIEPLEINGARIGVVLAASMHPYSQTNIEHFRVQLKNLSMAIHNAIIHEQIKELAAIDPLTGIYNRRYGLARLKEEQARSFKNNSPLGIAMMDLDHFKRINDNYGHLAGDKVLVTCIRIVKNMLREGDFVLRYGGEEFLIVLPGASLRDTFELIDKIRRVIEASIVQYIEFEIRITASMGFASIPETGILEQDDLLARIDEALYIAKETGRNRVVPVK